MEISLNYISLSKFISKAKLSNKQRLMIKIQLYWFTQLNYKLKTGFIVSVSTCGTAVNYI